MADSPEFQIITPDKIPEWECRAADAGQVLDHWCPIDGHDEIVAARLVASVEERDDARAYRYLRLVPPQR